MGRDTTPSERSINTAKDGLKGWTTPKQGSEPSWTSWRKGETEEEYYRRHGKEPPKSKEQEEQDKRRYERYRAEQMELGNKVYCPVCRSSSIKRLSDGRFLCVSKRPKWSCIARQGYSEVFTAKEAQEAGARWVNDIRRFG